MLVVKVSLPAPDAFTTRLGSDLRVTSDHGFVPTAQWCGNAMKNVPLASASALAARHARASSAFNFATTASSIKRSQSGADASNVAVAGNIVSRVSPALWKRRYRLASAQPCDSTEPMTPEAHALREGALVAVEDEQARAELPHDRRVDPHGPDQRERRDHLRIHAGELVPVARHAARDMGAIDSEMLVELAETFADAGHGRSSRVV